MTLFEQGYQDHALALGRDKTKAASAEYQAGWAKSKAETRNIINHGTSIRQENQKNTTLR